MNYNFEIDVPTAVKLVQQALGHVRQHELSPYRRLVGRQVPVDEL